MTAAIIPMVIPAGRSAAAPGFGPDAVTVLWFAGWEILRHRKVGGAG